MKIKCPSCSAEFETELDSKIQKCPYCKGSIFISKEFETLEKIVPIISFDNAKEIFLKKKIKEKFDLIYIPFYKVIKGSEEKYIPGIKNAGYELKNFQPQGDRIPVDKKIIEPEIDIENAMSIVFSPFYKTEKGIIMCAVTGNILNQYAYEEEKKVSIFPLIVFFISGILAIFIKTIALKIFIPFLFSLLIFLKKNEEHNIT